MDLRDAEASQPREKITPSCKWLFQMSCGHVLAFLLAILGCLLCHLAKGIQDWQIWEVDTIPMVPRVTVGLWKVCFMGQTMEGQYLKVYCKDLSKLGSALPSGILMAQIYMTCSAILQSLAMAFVPFVFWPSSGNKRQKVRYPLASIGILLNVISGLVTLVPLFWILSSIWRREGMPFPEKLGVPRFPREQHIGNAIYVGFVSAMAQILSGLLVLIEKRRKIKKSHPLAAVTVDPTPVQGAFQSPLLNVNTSSWTAIIETHVPTPSSTCSSPICLPIPPLSSPTPSRFLHSTSCGSAPQLHGLPLSSPPQSPFPPRWLSDPTVSSLTPSELPSPPRACSPLRPPPACSAPAIHHQLAQHQQSTTSLLTTSNPPPACSPPEVHHQLDHNEQSSTSLRTTRSRPPASSPPAVVHQQSSTSSRPPASSPPACSPPHPSSLSPSSRTPRDHSPPGPTDSLPSLPPVDI